MPLPVYLAMTASEIAHNPLPEKLAYMACHFSSYGCGLCDFPQQLPQSSILILNDRIPVWKHDPNTVVRQLREIVEQLQCEAILLDFQRPDNPATAAVAKAITAELSCPVGVAEHYAKDLSCAVFLSAPQPLEALQDHAANWNGQEIWLEAALETERVTLTLTGNVSEGIPYQLPAAPYHRDLHLCSTYHVEVTQQAATFTVSRTPADVEALAKQAQELGITRMIGLYQQLHAESLPPVLPEDSEQKNPAD